MTRVSYCERLAWILEVLLRWFWFVQLHIGGVVCGAPVNLYSPRLGIRSLIYRGVNLAAGAGEIGS